MDSLKKAFKIASVYTGLIIGAGFASGREIITFFISYGAMWPVGMIFTGILLSALGWMMLTVIERERVDTYSGFLKAVTGEKTAEITEVISGLFLCVLFFAMVSASGSLFNEAFGIDRIWGSIVLTVICFIVFKGGVDKLIDINIFLSPLMVLGTVVVCVISYFTRTETVIAMEGLVQKSPVMVFFSALIYVSYNIISSASVFTGMESIVRKDKKAKYGAVIGGSVMSLVGLMMGIILLTDINSAAGIDIPMLAITRNNSIIINYIYILVLIGAIITTAVGNGYGALKWIEHITGIKDTFADVLLCVAAVLFSFVAFEGFTDKIYPLFGIMGLAEMFCIFKYFLKDK